MQPNEHPTPDEGTSGPAAAAPRPAGRGRAVIDYRPYPTAPTRTRRSPANLDRPHTRQGNPPTPSTIWFTPTPTGHSMGTDVLRRMAAIEDADPAVRTGRPDAAGEEPSGTDWPLPVLTRAVASFTEPGAAVLLQPWLSAARGGHTETVPATAVDAVRELGRRPRIGALAVSTDGPATERRHPDGVDERVDLLITVMPARGDTAGQIDALARLAARALRLGGVLVVLTHCDRVGGVLVDPTGPMVTAGQNADLLYLQHIVAIDLPPADLRSHPAHRADSPAPVVHRRVHRDVLIFSQPHDDGARPTAARPSPL